MINILILYCIAITRISAAARSKNVCTPPFWAVSACILTLQTEEYEIYYAVVSFNLIELKICSSLSCKTSYMIISGT